MDGQSRSASDEAVERPLQVRFDQKMAKYGQVAAQKELRLIPAVFSHTGQIHEELLQRNKSVPNSNTSKVRSRVPK